MLFFIEKARNHQAKDQPSSEAVVFNDSSIIRPFKRKCRFAFTLLIRNSTASKISFISLSHVFMLHWTLPTRFGFVPITFLKSFVFIVVSHQLMMSQKPIPFSPSSDIMSPSLLLLFKPPPSSPRGLWTEWVSEGGAKAKGKTRLSDSPQSSLFRWLAKNKPFP